VLINISIINYTEARTEAFGVTVLGIPVQVQAVPGSYAWSFTSQGSPDRAVTTTDPDAPYPPPTRSTRARGPAIPGDAHTDSGTTALTALTKTTHLAGD